MHLPTPFDIQMTQFIESLEAAGLRTSVVATERALNGYRLGFVDYALQRIGMADRQYMLISVRSKAAADLAYMIGELQHHRPDFAIASPTQDSLLFVDTSHLPKDQAYGFGDIFINAGFIFEYESKFEKRGTSLLRPAPLFYHIPRPMHTLEVSPKDFMSSVDLAILRELGMDTLETRALDGMIIGRRSLLNKMVNHTKDEYLNEVPDRRRQAMTRRLNHPVHNFRLVSPDGMIKGQIIYIADKVFDKMYGTKADFVQMEGEIKSAIKHTDSTIILSDPQPGHHRMNFNIQSLCNRRYDAAEPNWIRDTLIETVDEQCEKALDPVDGPDYLFGNPDDLLDDIAEMSRNGGHISEITRLRLRGADLVIRGIHPRAIPDVMNNSLNFKRAHIRPNGKQVKFPAGKSGAHVQIISLAAAYMAGYTGPYVERDTIRYWKKYDVAIVNHLDYIISFYDNSGGSDHDDFFDMVEPASEGNVRKLVTWRNPSTMREYTILTIAGDWPITEAAPFTVTPQVKDLATAERHGDQVHAIIDEAMATITLLNPLAMANVTRAGFLNHALMFVDAVAYKGLPEGVKLHTGGQYSFPRFITMAEDRFNGEGSVDQAVASSMIMETSYGPIRGFRLCPMEDKVDTYVQGGSSEARAAVAEENKVLLGAAVRRAVAGEPFDARFAQMRSIPGIFYAQEQIPLPRKAMKKYTGKLDDSIDVTNRNWFGHFMGSTERYLDNKTAYAKKVVSDTAGEYAPECIREQASTYYGFDGSALFTNDGRTVSVRKSGEKPLPVDLTYGAAGLLRRFRIEQRSISEQREEEIAALGKEATKEQIEEITNHSYDLMAATAELMFNDRTFWDPNYCVDPEMLANSRFVHANRAIAAAKEGPLSTLDMDNLEDRYKMALSLAAACYVIPKKDGLISFFMFRSEDMWNLLMDAITYYGEGEFSTIDEIIEEANERNLKLKDKN